MEYATKYTKEEAIDKASEFLTKVRELEEEYAISFNSDSGNIYLTFQSSEEGKYWDNVKIGWKGDGTGLKVTEKTETDKRAEVLAKLTDEEKKLLGLV